MGRERSGMHSAIDGFGKLGQLTQDNNDQYLVWRGLYKGIPTQIIFFFSSTQTS